MEPDSCFIREGKWEVKGDQWGVGGSLSSSPVTAPSTRGGAVKVERGRDLEVTIGHSTMSETRGWIHFHNSNGTTLKKELGSGATDCAVKCAQWFFVKRNSCVVGRGSICSPNVREGGGGLLGLGRVPLTRGPGSQL